ncbi:hypothetical protein F441_14464 [Phytophthora nicotianae CJ01A1]|uniref:Uncharacterized protein n=5 Tax=Phytophthora nicotianae TaxID=4792 RepID=V9DVB8_PHYNI|nr:hypothetical protein F443_22301 [Phytophthora nicotianae P1569]ETK70985.1 hypothetical protein L915_21695 [Phytophthora nicotianae]ETO68581.1 hypothetical protein F444_14607 [Phytophthora nicotianae P1976]ETP09710.1 hypothetical protein F441_14464 [Phytophthora nicotianae CJ01A1]ETP52743.1 hypothetical protein F442_02290 [Phytophthora nicotianae P10297]
METIETSVANVAASQDAAGSDLLQMLAFFQKQADRRAELEEKLRREERQERRNAEKEERQERDQIRRDEAAVANSRHEQIMETHRADQENSRQNREAEREDRKAEMEESRRRFDKQMELDRSEARQRHEQMMLLITSMVQKKQ